MIGIYLICMILFPCCVLCPMYKQKNNRNELLSIENSNVIKGIAICFVMLAHLVDALERKHAIGILKIYTVLGGMGVLLFFFLSGYGLYKGYANKTPSKNYIVKRMKNVVIPYLIVKTIYYVIICILDHEKLTTRDFLLNYTDWFIVVILIEYLLFYIVWLVSYKMGKKCSVAMNFLLSILLAIVFWRVGLVARWYNGLILFPIGMLIAKHEKKIISFMNSEYLLKLGAALFGFMVMGGLFTVFKGALWADFIKMIAGMFLAIVVCFVFMKLELRTVVMKYIGKQSLYFYIIHLCLMKLLDMYDIGAYAYFYLVLAITFVVTWIFEKIVSFILKN